MYIRVCVYVCVYIYIYIICHYADNNSKRR